MSETTTADKKPRKPRTPRPRLTLNTIAASIVPPETVAARKRSVNRSAKPRSAEQLAIDNLTTKAHQAWVKAGKPSDWAKCPGANVRCLADQLETLKTAVYNAGTFLGFTVRFGSVTETEVDGKVYADVVYTVRDKLASDAKNKPASDKK
jgi:hypothetical protein